MGRFDYLKGFDCISLESTRKDNTHVQTTVWFVVLNDKLYITTKSSTGKVKRIRHTSAVRFMPCTSKGISKGEWDSGNAIFVTGTIVDKIISLRKKKYGFRARLAGMMSSFKGETIVIVIT